MNTFVMPAGAEIPRRRRANYGEAYDGDRGLNWNTRGSIPFGGLTVYICVYVLRYHHGWCLGVLFVASHG